MILYGVSGHAKVIYDCLKSQQTKVLACIDDDKQKTHWEGFKIEHIYDQNYLPEIPLIISVGINRIRKKLALKIKHSFGKAIHRSAIIAEDVIINEGSVIFHGSIIQSGSSIGKHCIINTGASIDHDCIIHDYVHISPQAALSGTVEVGEGTHIGTGAAVINNCKIGKWCSIGVGTVIIKDIPDYAVVVGNPGKIIKFNNHEFTQ